MEVGEEVGLGAGQAVGGLAGDGGGGGGTCSSPPSSCLHSEQLDLGWTSHSQLH